MDSKAGFGQLNLAHVTRKKKYKKETKINKRQCPLSSVRVQDLWRQSRRNHRRLWRQESPADAGIPARRKNDWKKILHFEVI